MGSGIDIAWEVSGMYGSATVNQIIEGKHIYRGIQAHITTLIALYKIKLESNVSTDEERRTIQLKISNLEGETSAEIDRNKFMNSILNLQQEFTTCGILKKLYLKNESRQTATFLDNYTAQVINLLNCIGATRIKS